MRKGKILHNNPEVVWDGKKTQVKWQGRLKPLSDWARELAPELNVAPLTIKNRIYQGWSIAEAFTTAKLREKPQCIKKEFKNEQSK